MTTKNLVRLAFLISCTAVMFVVFTVAAFGQVHANSFIHVQDFSKDGPHETTILNTFTFVKDHADAKCIAWFGSTMQGGNLREGIIALEGLDTETRLLGHGSFSIPTLIAFTGNDARQTDVPAGVIMTFNDTGLFFVPILHMGVGNYDGGTNKARVMTVIHELGHFLNAPGFQADFASMDKVEANNDLVEKNCRETINAAGKLPNF